MMKGWWPIPAQSKKQRRLMGMAEHHPEMISAKNRGVLRMSKKQLHEFASTKEVGLPTRKTKTKKKMASVKSHPYYR